MPPALRELPETGDPAEINAVLDGAMAQSPGLAFSLNRDMLTHGFATPLAYVRGPTEYAIKSLADRITCLSLICATENGSLCGDAKPLCDKIVAPKEFALFTNA
jgi:hypothetical protein